jgi:hypothetical protein
MLITLEAVVSAILFAADYYGSSGAGLVIDNAGGHIPHRDEQPNCVIQTRNSESYAIPVRPFPARDLWFESVWKAHRSKYDLL